MTFAKDLAISFAIFALVGALHAAGILGSDVKDIVHSSWLFAVAAYAVALSMRGGFGPRPLPVRMRSLAVAWIALGIGSAFDAEGLFLLAAFVAAIAAARSVLPSPKAEASQEYPSK